MEDIKLITGNTADEVWAQVSNDFNGQEILMYDAVLQQQGLPQIILKVEIDLGGGFESGYEWTRFSAPVTTQNEFRFALHHAGFLDKAGKFLGLEDKEVGYDEFDKEFIIKTNDEQKVKTVFADADLRSFFQSLEEFNLHITHHEDSEIMLELEIDRGITDAAELRTIYDAFSKVLLQLAA